MTLALAWLAAAAASPPQIVFRDVMTPVAQIRLGDVADLRALPQTMRLRASALELAQSPRNKAWRHSDLAARARALMPALGPWLSGSYRGRLRFASEPARTPIVAIAARTPVARGDTVSTRLTTGIFTIEREATALQAGVPGAPIFVRVGDDVVTAICCGEVE